MKNGFKVGKIACAEENLSLKLLVRSYLDRIYNCTVQNGTSLKDLEYFERELVNNDKKANQN
jgi:hypothetical protein